MKESKGLPLHTSASGSWAFVGLGSTVVGVLAVVMGSLSLSGNGVVAAAAIVGFASVLSKLCKVGVNRLEISAKVSEEGIRSVCFKLDTTGTSVLFVSSS